MLSQYIMVSIIVLVTNYFVKILLIIQDNFICIFLI